MKFPVVFTGQVEGGGGGQREDVLWGEDQLHRGTGDAFVKTCYSRCGGETVAPLLVDVLEEICAQKVMKRV